MRSILLMGSVRRYPANTEFTRIPIRIYMYPIRSDSSSLAGAAGAGPAGRQPPARSRVLRRPARRVRPEGPESDRSGVSEAGSGQPQVAIVDRARRPDKGEQRGPVTELVPAGERTHSEYRVATGISTQP